MDGMSVDYYFKTDNGQRFLYMRIGDVNCDVIKFSNLLTEIGESLVYCSYENICIDLSPQPIVTSLIFGVCVNIVSAAKTKNKKIKFRFSADAMETAKLAAFNDLVETEPG
jgi:hypothetical protein